MPQGSFSRPKLTMTTCEKKCRCLQGPFAGQLYNSERPCGATTYFNEDQCACEFLPCEYCGTENGEPGKCADFAPLHPVTGEPQIANQIDITLTGKAFSRGGVWTPLLGYCGAERSNNNIETITVVEFNETPIASISCPVRSDQTCPKFGLYFDPAPYFCSSPLPGSLFRKDTGWRPGSFYYLSLVDENYDQLDWQNYYIATILEPYYGLPRPGAYSYYAPMEPFDLGIKCKYPPPEGFG